MHTHRRAPIRTAAQNGFFGVILFSCKIRIHIRRRHGILRAWLFLRTAADAIWRHRMLLLRNTGFPRRHFEGHTASLPFRCTHSCAHPRTAGPFRPSLRLKYAPSIFPLTTAQSIPPEAAIHPSRLDWVGFDDCDLFLTKKHIMQRKRGLLSFC